MNYQLEIAKKIEFLQTRPEWGPTGTSYKTIALSSMNQKLFFLRNFFVSMPQIGQKSIENERRIQRLVKSTAKLFITNWLHVVFVLPSLNITARKAGRKANASSVLKHFLVISLRNHYCKKLFPDMKSYGVKEEAKGRLLHPKQTLIQTTKNMAGSETVIISDRQPPATQKQKTTHHID